MSIQRIGCGPRMSDAVVHGNTVYLAGRVATGARGHSVTEQTKDILGLIEKTLAEAGTDKTRLLSVQIFIQDFADFAGMNRAWDAWIDRNHLPARATVKAELANPSWRIEVTGVAALP